MVCLVMVCSGVCAGVLANIAVGGPKSRKSDTVADVALASRGLSINLRWGDFIEACFPFMARNAAVNISAHAAAVVGGAIVGASQCRSSAYLPLPLAIIAAETSSSSSFGLVTAVAAAFLIPFLVTSCCHRSPDGTARTSNTPVVRGSGDAQELDTPLSCQHQGPSSVDSSVGIHSGQTGGGGATLAKKRSSRLPHTPRQAQSPVVRSRHRTSPNSAPTGGRTPLRSGSSRLVSGERFGYGAVVSEAPGSQSAHKRRGVCDSPQQQSWRRTRIRRI